jgi:hypothetical protein
MRWCRRKNGQQRSGKYVAAKPMSSYNTAYRHEVLEISPNGKSGPSHRSNEPVFNLSQEICTPAHNGRMAEITARSA